MKTHLEELWAYRDLIRNLVVRDLKVRYKDSILGVMWSWLNPLLMMMIFTLVFGVLWRHTDIKNYHIFFMSALLPWNFFQDSVMGGLNTILSNGHLVKKVYFPREVLPISFVISTLVNFLVALPVFFALALISGTPITPYALLLPIPISIEVLFSIGIVFFLSTLEVFYRDTHMLTSPLIQAWFFLTPIIYPARTLPTQAHLLGITFNAQAWMFRLNPMASIINAYQDLLYYGTLTAMDFLTRTAVTAGLIFVLGYLFFLKKSPRFGETL